MASIKKISDKKYKITVSNGYRPDGRKIAKAKTITVPTSVQKRGIPQYVAHEAEELERLVKNGFGEDAETLFQEYAEKWLERQVKYAPGTLGSYRRMLAVVYPYIGAIPLCRLRPIALENMLRELRKRTHHGKPVQEATVQKYLTVVSAVLSDAKRNEIIQKNPARMIDLPDTEKRQQFIPTEEQAHRFLLTLRREPWHYLVYYLLALSTGCRRGELCALKWSDFEMHDGNCSLTMTVSRSRSSAAGQGIVEGTTKSGKARTVLLDEDMGALLMAYRIRKFREAEAGRFPLSEYLFTNERGELIHPDTFTKHLRKLFDRNGFPRDFHLHTLRHFAVSTMLHHGVDKQTVADLVGHADTSFLERTYCHPQLALKQKAASILSSALFDGVGSESA